MKKIYPVIHHNNIKQTLLNADIAVEAGVDGVFLISMIGDDEALNEAHLYVKSKYSDLKVGINHLTKTAYSSLKFNLERDIEMTWTDNCGICDGEALDVAYRISNLLKDNPKHEFFGAIAFKYQKTDHKPDLSASLAEKLGIITTTSGAATGIAPDVEKLSFIKSGLKNGKMAVASGVTPENAHVIAPYVDYILVSTGIEAYKDVFDLDKLKQLVENVKNASNLKPTFSLL